MCKFRIRIYYFLRDLTYSLSKSQELIVLDKILPIQVRKFISNILFQNVFYIPVE